MLLCPNQASAWNEYLMDAIGTMRGVCDEAAIAYAPSATAITMRPKDKEYPLTVVMPLRV